MTQEQKLAVFSYLDKLRRSGKINMFTAPEVIAKVFNVEYETAVEVFWEWAEAFERKEEE
jgi:hypothetical protein